MLLRKVLVVSYSGYVAGVYNAFILILIKPRSRLVYIDQFGVKLIIKSPFNSHLDRKGADWHKHGGEGKEGSPQPTQPSSHWPAASTFEWKYFFAEILCILEILFMYVTLEWLNYQGSWICKGTHMLISSTKWFLHAIPYDVKWAHSLIS